MYYFLTFINAVFAWALRLLPGGRMCGVATARCYYGFFLGAARQTLKKTGKNRFYRPHSRPHTTPITCFHLVPDDTGAGLTQDIVVRGWVVDHFCFLRFLLVKEGVICLSKP